MAARQRCLRTAGKTRGVRYDMLAERNADILTPIGEKGAHHEHIYPQGVPQNGSGA